LLFLIFFLKCDGTIHLLPVQVADGGDISFLKAVAATPPGCMLAPVRSVEDIELYATYFPGRDDFYVGVAKSWPDAVATGQLTDFTNKDRTKGWYNLDGSSVPADLDLWIPIGSFEPDGTNADGIPFTIAYVNFDSGSTALGLDDADGTTDQAEFALYECCLEFSAYTRPVVAGPVVTAR